ncbi:MAG: acyl-CoA dehydrogenase [Proteobacteria bacterium]|nr:acyl-CoA dehydrogenase [Pseudomonadota bacterium]
MEFLLSTDLIEYSQILRKYFSEKYTFEVLKKYIANGHTFTDKEKKNWQDLAELGCFSTFIAESQGGLGLGALSLAVTIEEAARVLCPLPIFETLVLGALPLSLYLNEKELSRFLPKIISGETIFTGSLSSNLNISNKKGLNAEVTLIPNLEIADNLLLTAKSGLFYINKESLSTLEKEEITTFDLSSKYFQINFKEYTKFEVLADKIDLNLFYHQAIVFSSVALSAIAKKVLEMTVEYVKTRKQYGKTIGSFQAIQHKLAEMSVLVEQSLSLSRVAAWCIDNDTQQLQRTALSAKSFASENTIKVIEMAIQAHGGIGFTYEYELHYYLRKAQVLANSFTRTEDNYEKLAELC